MEIVFENSNISEDSDLLDYDELILSKKRIFTNANLLDDNDESLKKVEEEVLEAPTAILPKE